MTPAILVDNLSKHYRIGELQRETTLRDAITAFAKHPLQWFTCKSQLLRALENVSFDVKQGEVVGIVGRNGAGKSTLLKVLSKITYPTHGTVRVRGRTASLLEVGTGFHSELTGRENIYLNGSILGMRKSEIDTRFDEIVAFAGVDRFIDTPIKRYSSGMELRLGFAVAAHLSADVLFVDEVLAVGDSEFQKKCLRAMDEMRTDGRTVLFVSHNMAAVENLCSRAIWIDQGQVRADGPSQQVISEYLAAFKAGQLSATDFRTIQNRRGSGEIRYTGLEILDPDGQPKNPICCGDRLTFRLRYHAEKTISNPHFGIELYTDLGTLVASVNTWSSGYEVPAAHPGEGSIELSIDSLNLIPGRYYLSLWLAGVGPKYDHLDYCSMIDVEPSDFYGSGRGMDRRFGIVLFPCTWFAPVDDRLPQSILAKQEMK